MDLQYFVHLVCVLSPFAADQTVLSPRISRHKICLGHKLIEFDFFRALSFLMKMSFRRATPSSPKKLETKAHFPKISPIWWQVIMRSQGPASHAAIIDCYFLFLTRPGSDYWLALSLTNWLLLKPPTKSLLILMLLLRLMLNESVGVWRQIGDSLELGNSLTTAKPKFVTFGQSLFIVCVDSLLWKALNCCWVCVYNTGRRQPWESAPRKLDPSLQNLISRYLLSPSIHIYPQKEIVFFI